MVVAWMHDRNSGINSTELNSLIIKSQTAKELQNICTASCKAKNFFNNERQYLFEISFSSYSWAQWIILYNLKILAGAWRPVIVPIQPGIVKPILKIILSAPLCTIDSSNHYMSVQYLHVLILTSLQRISIHRSIM